MGQLGVGVMLGILGGRSEEQVDDLKARLGQTITDAKIENDKLKLTFEDGKVLSIWDGGQSCCESRWMHTDDNLTDSVGTKLIDVEVANGPEEEDEDEWGGSKESQFLRIRTDRGVFTIVNYNEHNGYYGGFYIQTSVD